MINNSFSGTAFDLTGHCALITGAAGVLGAEHAAALLHTGCKVVLTDLSDLGLRRTENKLLLEFPESDLNIKRMDVSNASCSTLLKLPFNFFCVLSFAHLGRMISS